METLKKILVFIKDFIKGSLYPGFAVGLMLLFAAAMFYFQPFDYLSDQPLPSKDPQRIPGQQAWRLFKLGLEILAACMVLKFILNKGESWWMLRPAKAPKVDSKAAPEAEASKEAA